MLDSIILRDVATYDSTGVEINDLKKINFIYGANGSGKTTLTKFVHDPENENYQDCSLTWKNNLPVETRVYNKDFRDRNFGKGKMDGIFTLGQATKEQIQAIELMQVELSKLKDEEITKNTSLEQHGEEEEEAEDDFKESIWQTAYKKYERDFKEAFTGYMQKEKFKDKILSEFPKTASQPETHNTLKEKAKTIFGKPPVSMQFITKMDFSRVLEIEKDKIWQKKIIGKSDVGIAGLIQMLNLNDWVNEGRSYLQEDETCPFCQQQTITKDFRKQLENYFDETFTHDTATAKACAEEYNRLAQNLLNHLFEIETREKANEETKLNIESFSALLKTLTSQFAANKELLNNKIKEPSRSIELVAVQAQLEGIEQLIIQCNAEIKKHNDIVDDFTNQRSKLVEAIWNFLIEENRVAIEAFNRKVANIQKLTGEIEKRLNELSVQHATLSNEIKEANKNVTSTQPSVDEINGILKSYGFLNFEIVPSKTEPNQYQIHRQDGTIAESTLSEGETTFITFLYFLQQAKGSTQRENITEERILVIDDPISSLDSNVLFIVSSLIKEIIKDIHKKKGPIKQLILLTHNVYFHKEVSFVKDKKGPNARERSFWVLRRNKNISSIQAFGTDNPILSSYELLWKELVNRDQNSGITIQNTMRRILEHYFKILGGHNDDKIIKSFENHEEQEICRSLICWLNDGSHGITDDIYVQRLDEIIDTYFDVFRKIFRQMGHEEHYNMMFRTPATEETAATNN
ncbi:AAA family ATPase [Chitinophaga sp. GbtcB8]|uniref:AAA family ATPase n=1 Tax=Chitinophaga sp. GbtcB8 TaxID=2824753 RepID=UPI001C30391F|nr:AAA family ATPase [Chitinophaga sp. GbtcB8]